MENEVLHRTNDVAMDELEAFMLTHFEPLEFPLVHRFTDKMYIREMSMPAGSLWTSRIHATENPFVVSMGRAWVKIDNGSWECIEAPYTGITKPGTRRVLYIERDCIWTTFHVNEDNCQDIETIENRLTEQHINCITNSDIHKDCLKVLANNKILST